MTYQRISNGLPAKFYPLVEQVDNRGNTRFIAETDPAKAIDATVWVFPQRSARAEVTGQQKINIVKIGVKIDLPGVDIGSLVEFDNRRWDIVTPPAYHHGASRHVRHFEFDVRERTSG